MHRRSSPRLVARLPASTILPKTQTPPADVERLVLKVRLLADRAAAQATALETLVDAGLDAARDGRERWFAIGRLRPVRARGSHDEPT